MNCNRSCDTVSPHACIDTKEVAAAAMGGPAALVLARAQRNAHRETKTQSLFWRPGSPATSLKVKSGSICESSWCALPFCVSVCMWLFNLHVFWLASLFWFNLAFTSLPTCTSSSSVHTGLVHNLRAAKCAVVWSIEIYIMHLYNLGGLELFVYISALKWFWVCLFIDDFHFKYS